MGTSFWTKIVGFTLLLRWHTAAQLSGRLSFDGEQTMTITITNPSQDNMTMIGSNDLFDRLNLVPFQPISLTDISGAPVTLNGTRYTPPPLTDDAFQEIPPGGTYARAIDMSNYLLGAQQGGAVSTNSQCFIAALPESLYGLNTTGFRPNEALAEYYLTKGLIAVQITSAPIHFNYSVPLDFTNDQKAYIEADAALRSQQAAATTATTTARRRRREARI